LPAVPVHAAIPAVVILPPEIETSKSVVPEIPHVAPPILASIPLIKASGFTEDKPASPVPALKPVVKAAGFESSETSATGPVRGALSALGSFESAHSAEGAPVRTAVARAGAFGDASASATGAAHRNVVSSAAFGDTTVERNAVAARQIPVASRLTPVEILSKPRPEFTAEARAKNIEGEVLLEVQFMAIGEVRVLRVVRGLGHGLDESAVAAAQAIRFRPAARDGAAVDSTAMVHIVFQLAN
jgi:TonB family protein